MKFIHWISNVPCSMNENKSIEWKLILWTRSLQCNTVKRESPRWVNYFCWECMGNTNHVLQYKSKTLKDCQCGEDEQSVFRFLKQLHSQKLEVRYIHFEESPAQIDNDDCVTRHLIYSGLLSSRAYLCHSLQPRQLLTFDILHLSII